MLFEIIVFGPLLGALLAGFLGNRLGARFSQIVTCGFLILSAVLSWVAFKQVALDGQWQHVKVMHWIDSGALSLDWALKIDTLTAVMLVVVNTVSSLVHVYSIGYMSHDPHRPRFMAYLSLFTFAMLMLVTADNFVQMFFGWEGVGPASYLLIGFWYKKPSANAAAIKAFVVNRVGDFGFSLGIFSVFVLFGSVNFDTVFAAAPTMVGKTIHFLSWNWDALTVTCLLLFVGAMGKSAQLLLHTWLPDAMEGPTPVSALIHAATMVTAGVFLVCRCSPLFELAPTALDVVAAIGATTAFFAATVGLVQNDIKRIIAYSTCSQLGYMFFAAGVSAYGAAMFHLFTHAFFKALLFLCSGSVIHALHEEQDIRRMGGLFRKIPYTGTLMWIGSLALAGIGIPGLDIGFAGFYSKDMILESAFASHSPLGQYAFGMGIIAAFMTAFYSWRLLFMTFHGQTRADHHHFDHAHEAPPSMMIPLVILAVGALAAGFVFNDYFVGEKYAEFWKSSLYLAGAENVMHVAHHTTPMWVAIAPLAVGVTGIALAWLFYIRDPKLPRALARSQEPLYLFLLNKWYFDELYNVIFVRPAMWLGRFLWKKGDGLVIDGIGPDGVSGAIALLAEKAKKLQTGYVYHYAFAMMIGVAALVTYYSTLVKG